MQMRSGKDAAARIAGILQEKFQVHRFTVDLTLKTLAEVDPVGRLDFGGSGYAAAGRIPITPRPLRPEDRYLWWDLGRGCYFAEFNEALNLEENELAFLEPHERLLRTGGTHAPALLRGRVAPIEALLVVEVSHLQIMLNARISRIRLFSLNESPADPKSARHPRAKQQGRR